MLPIPPFRGTSIPTIDVFTVMPRCSGNKLGDVHHRFFPRTELKKITRSFFITPPQKQNISCIDVPAPSMVGKSKQYVYDVLDDWTHICKPNFQFTKNGPDESRCRHFSASF